MCSCVTDHELRVLILHAAERIGWKVVLHSGRWPNEYLRCLYYGKVNRICNNRVCVRTDCGV